MLTGSHTCFRKQN